MNVRKGYVLVALGIGIMALLALMGILQEMGEGTPAEAAGTERVATGTVTETLMALFDSTTGASWAFSDTWGSTTTSYCTWYGVSCDGYGEVVELDLSGNNLSGTIPSELGTLSSLWDLDLSGNNLSDTIPPELGNLGSLWELDLSENSLSGSIPPELGNLNNVRWLYLNSNDLSGSIPPELGNLSSVVWLYLSGNDLSGTIPPQLGNLSSVEWLYLGGNDLSGPIPPELGNLGSLGVLNLGGNRLSGPIPLELLDLGSLWQLDLYNNNLSGPIPPELGNMDNLMYLFLAGNNLSGPIPAELSGLSSLQYLWLYGNPYLSCWETEGALDWARGLTSYVGPKAVCFYVDQDATGANDGTSWASAYTALESALSLTLTVPGAGAEIWVAEGIYTPTYQTDETDPRSATFQLISGTALYGGFAGTESGRQERVWAAHPTVLSGDLEGDDLIDPYGVVTTTENVRGSNSYHVVTGSGADATAVLDGFIVTAGRADKAVTDNGGGIVNSAGSPTLRNMILSGNYAAMWGGGLYSDAGSPTVTGVRFRGNLAISGGGVFGGESGTLTLDGCTVGPDNNVNAAGGGIDNRGIMTVTNSTIMRNSGTGIVGGAGIANSDVLSLTNCTVSGNETNVAGGGILVSAGSVGLSHCTITGNTADLDATGPGGGGGIYIETGSAQVKNSIIAGNGLGEGGTALGPDLYGTAFMSLGYNLIGNADNSTGFDQIGDQVGDGATPIDPMLEGLVLNPPGDTATHALQEGSPALDWIPYGVNGCGTAVTSDQRGSVRPERPGGACDIGAFEQALKVYLPLVVR